MSALNSNNTFDGLDEPVRPTPGGRKCRLDKEKKKKLKLQAAMEGTSHPAPPTGGFRKTGNGEQYAFKKVNIEERVIVIYMCQTCCQLVALCP